MSKIITLASAILVVFACNLQIFTQSDRPRVEISVKDTTTIRVSIDFVGYGHEIKFVNEYAGIGGLSGRISGLKTTDTQRKPMTYRSLADGTYVADRSIGALSYDVDLKAASDPASRVHVSWLDDDRGVLMLGDLLPQTEGPLAAWLQLNLPVGWMPSTAERGIGSTLFDVLEPDKAIITIGKNLRQNDERLSDADIQYATPDRWHFTDDEASKMISAIASYYSKILGPLKAPRRKQVVLVKLRDQPPGTWKAETRGRNILIASSDMPFRSQSLQRLHEQLRHELFHLWIPNGVNLSGNYDWFYEGFALYQSLRLGVEANRIRFEDFLDTLSRASQLSAGTHRPISLIEASRQRWAGNSSQVYTRGMIVAFLCDLILLDESRGKSGVTEILEEIYKRHGGGAARLNAETAILSTLRAHERLRPVVDRYITGNETFVIGEYLKLAGLTLGSSHPAQISVEPKLAGRQKVVLDRLGYNSWRKLSDSKND
ncbi:MAG: hypothetical protein WKF34_10980 [Pyrinomonadaceae bacterium]